MVEALEIGQASATGGLQLFAGKLLSTVILAVGTVVLGYFILAGDYGLYIIALIPANTALLFQDWGVSVAIARNCARYRAANDPANLRKIITTGIFFAVITGLALSVLSGITANFIATTIFHEPESALLIILASTTILSTSIFWTAQNIFVGFERMKLSSYAFITQTAVQASFSPLLVFFGYGALGAVLGYTLASLAGGIISIALLYFRLIRNLNVPTTPKINFKKDLKPLLIYGVPLALSDIALGILGSVSSFIMAFYCSATIIGNYQIALNFSALLALFSAPISKVLFPVFAKLDPNRERHVLQSVFTYSARYAALLMVPATLAMMALSTPIIATLYGNRFVLAPSLLSIAVVSNLLVLFGNISVDGLFAAVGETKLLMKLNLLTLATGIPISLILIPQFGITGLILSLFLSSTPHVFIGLRIARKKYEARIDLKTSAKIFIASTTAAAATYLFLTTTTLAAWLQLIAGAAIFALVTLITAAPIGAITRTDTRNLRIMFQNHRLLAKLIEIPLKLIEKLLRQPSQEQTFSN